MGPPPRRDAASVCHHQRAVPPEEGLMSKVLSQDQPDPREEGGGRGHPGSCETETPGSPMSPASLLRVRARRLRDSALGNARTCDPGNAALGNIRPRQGSSAVSRWEPHLLSSPGSGTLSQAQPCPPTRAAGSACERATHVNATATASFPHFQHKQKEFILSRFKKILI